MTDTLRPYTPSLRDRLRYALMGDSHDSTRAHFINGLLKPGGLADFTPLGVPLNAYDAGRAGASGQYVNSLLSGIAAIPALGPLAGKIAGGVKEARAARMAGQDFKTNAFRVADEHANEVTDILAQAHRDANLRSPLPEPASRNMNIEDIIGPRIGQLGTPSKVAPAQADIAKDEIWGTPRNALKPSPYNQGNGRVSDLAAHIDRQRDAGLTGDEVVERVNPNSLLSTQLGLSHERSPDDVFDGLSEYPVVARTSDGSMHVVDGHHRVNEAINRGDKKINAFVFDTPTNNMSQPTKVVSGDQPNMSRRGFLGVGAGAAAASVIGLPHFMKPAAEAIQAAAPAAEAIASPLEAHLAAYQSHRYAVASHGSVLDQLEAFGRAGHNIEAGELPDDFWLSQGGGAKQTSMKANEDSHHSFLEGPHDENVMHAQDMAADAESQAHNAIPSDPEDYEHIMGNHEDAYNSHLDASYAHLRAAYANDPEGTIKYLQGQPGGMTYEQGEILGIPNP